MRRFNQKLAVSTTAVALTVGLAAPALATPIQTVFVIAMENHNWTQPNGNVGQFSTIQQIKDNPNAPFINSLVNGTATATINGQQVNISQQTAYTNTYYNVLAGTGQHIHPSEPSYIWAEASTNFGVLNDNQPYQASGGTVQNTTQHLSSYLMQVGDTWRSYQEDIDLQKNAVNKTINTPLPQVQWVVPVSNSSGTFGSGSPANQYNGSQQFDYAAKHNPQVFFKDTTANNDPSNPAYQQLAQNNYAPLQQLATDLKNDTVAQYNWITPDQFNDMHTTLAGGYEGLTGDAARIKQGDDFLSQIVPEIMASDAYKNNGAIILWWDESESQGTPGDNADDFNHTIPEIVISSLAHPNVNGKPYASDGIAYSHSSDLRTMQEIFQVGPFLGDAANSHDLADLFAPGMIQKGIPEPGSLALLASGIAGLGWFRRRSRR
jgi:hypothetical protein